MSSMLLNPHVLGTVWTPASIASHDGAWIDASVTASLTDAGSGLCSNADDQYGGDDDATSPSGYRPTIGTDATSGRGKLGFSSKYMTIASNARLHNNAGVTVWWAGNITSWATYSNLFIKDAEAWNAPGWRIINNNGTVQVTFQTSNGAKTCNYGTAASMTGRMYLVARCGTTSNKLEIWKNGSSVTSVASTGTLSSTASNVLLMADTAGTGNVTGDLYECGIAAVDISDSDLSALHSYLSSKWSI